MKKSKFLAAVIAVLLLASPKASGASIRIESIAPPLSSEPQILELDVYVAESPGAAESIAGFQLRLAIVGPDEGLHFLEAMRPTDHEYVFDNSALGPFASISDDGRFIDIGDFLDEGQAILQEGAGFATLRLLLDGRQESASYEITAVGIGDSTFLAVDATNFLPLSVSAGFVNSVPEPSSATIFFFLFTATLLTRRLRRTCDVVLG